MFEKAKPARDAFTFSLGGMKTIASFVTAPAIADDRINKIRDDRAQQVRDDCNRKSYPSRVFQRQAAQSTCA